MEKLPSIDLIYEMMIDQHKLISDWCDALDNKVIGLFGITTLFIGIITTLNKSNLGLNWSLVAFAVAIVAFVLSSCYSFRSFLTRRFSLGLDPRVLLRDYAILQPQETKQHLIEFDSQHWEQNVEVLNEKSHALHIAIIWGAIEIIALIFWVILV